VFFLLACGYILIRDRKDWFNYVIVALAALFVGGTKVGSSIGPWLTQRAADIDGIIKGIFG
jgi:hypothetical protein